MLATANAPLAAESYSEHAVKAAFLFRFSGYVEWPEAPARAPSEPFTIALLGAHDDLRLQLERMTSVQLIKNRPVRTRAIDHLGQLGDAQVLFVGTRQTRRLRSQKQLLSGKHVLVVTDDVAGLDAGGIINFVALEKRIRFEVSLGAAQRAGIRISSDLLAVASKVREAAIQPESCRHVGEARPAACSPRAEAQ